MTASDWSTAPTCPTCGQELSREAAESYLSTLVCRDCGATLEVHHRTVPVGIGMESLEYRLEPVKPQGRFEARHA
ncbi:MAG TPA: hypothetical protein VHN99_02235 [Deinococcales bacterium]|nr:hypothetical protein [Deinococcales bacterium]